MKNFAKHQMITGLRVIHSLPVTFPGHCVTRSVGMTLRNIISSSIPRLVRHPEQHTYYPSTTANCIIWWWVPGRCWWIWSIVKGFSSNQVHISMWTNTYWSQIHSFLAPSILFTETHAQAADLFIKHTAIIHYLSNTML